MMKLAIAVDQDLKSKVKSTYRVWYLKLNEQKKVVGLSRISKEDLVKDLFEDYRVYGDSKWLCFPECADHSKKIEIYDFISKNKFENTHFGQLPTIDNFQKVLDEMKIHLQVKLLAG